MAAIVLDGSGTEELTPSRRTLVEISNHDPNFENQVTAHNLWCETKPGCRKAEDK